jgi:probable phosphoglycerate mutase
VRLSAPSRRACWDRDNSRFLAPQRGEGRLAPAAEGLSDLPCGRTPLRTTIHFIRHADAAPPPQSPIDTSTTYDALGLSAKGVAQAAALARRIATGRTRPVAVYTSPVRRARETAGALAAALNLAVGFDEDLREVYLGELTAGDVPAADRADTIRARLEELAQIAARDGSWDAVPHAEPAQQVRARVAKAVGTIVERHPGAHIAVVSHAGTINAYLAGIIGARYDFFFPTGNTSLSSVTFSAGVAMLLRLNDTAHLELPAV